MFKPNANDGYKRGSSERERRSFDGGPGRFESRKRAFDDRKGDFEGRRGGLKCRKVRFEGGRGGLESRRARYEGRRGGCVRGKDSYDVGRKGGNDGGRVDSRRGGFDGGQRDEAKYFYDGRPSLYSGRGGFRGRSGSFGGQRDETKYFYDGRPSLYCGRGGFRGRYGSFDSNHSRKSVNSGRECFDGSQGGSRGGFNHKRLKEYISSNYDYDSKGFNKNSTQVGKTGQFDASQGSLQKSVSSGKGSSSRRDYNSSVIGQYISRDQSGSQEKSVSARSYTDFSVSNRGITFNSRDGYSKMDFGRNSSGTYDRGYGNSGDYSNKSQISSIDYSFKSYDSSLPRNFTTSTEGTPGGNKADAENLTTAVTTLVQVWEKDPPALTVMEHPQAVSEENMCPISYSFSGNTDPTINVYNTTDSAAQNRKEVESAGMPFRFCERSKKKKCFIKRQALSKKIKKLKKAMYKMKSSLEKKIDEYKKFTALTCDFVATCSDCDNSKHMDTKLSIINKMLEVHERIFNMDLEENLSPSNDPQYVKEEPCTSTSFCNNSPAKKGPRTIRL